MALLTAEELQAIRDRSTFVPDGTVSAWMRYAAPAPEDRAALLSHIDATEGEGSPRCQAVQVLCRAIVAARGEIKDGTILDMAESLLREQREQFDALPPWWLPAPPIVPPETETWVWMEHRVAPVRVRACREGVADVLWWDDEIGVGDLPYQKVAGWRLWVGSGEGRRWAGRGGRPE